MLVPGPEAVEIYRTLLWARTFLKRWGEWYERVC